MTGLLGALAALPSSGGGPAPTFGLPSYLRPV